MNGVAKIRKALKSIMSEGEANACRIYKGYGAQGEGWYVEPFGSHGQNYGTPVTEALETIRQRADYQEEVRSGRS
jgi:hypothetical protein